RFVKVNSEWGLTSWYPGMGKGKKAKHRLPPLPVKKPRPVTTDSLGTKAFAFLSRNSGISFTALQIAEEIGASKDSVAAALSPLLKADKISRPDRGQYQVNNA